MKKKLFVEGMTCGHCVMHVENALKEVEGVMDVAVSLKGKFADVDLNENVEDANLVAAVEEAGYSVVKIEE